MMADNKYLLPRELVQICNITFYANISRADFDIEIGYRADGFRQCFDGSGEIHLKLETQPRKVFGFISEVRGSFTNLICEISFQKSRFYLYKV